jgi:poly(hydroxyalkanoate) granule-associated protein
MATKKKSASEPLTESAHRIWLAGLGALATAEQEGSKLFRELVAKGESFDASVQTPVRSARGKVRETIDGVRSKAGKTVERLESAFDDRVQDVLQRLGVPSRDEIASLSRRVEKLTEAVDSAAGPAKKRTATRKKAAAKKSTTRKAAAKKTPKKKVAKKKTSR